MHRSAFFGRSLLPFVFTFTLSPEIAFAQAVATVSASVSSLSPIEIKTNPNGDPSANLYDPSVTVLEADDLRVKGRVTVEEALRYVPGIDVARSGGPGQQTSIFIRGARSEDTLVLIDGVEMNDPTGPARAFDFANLMLSNIERIEIFRGPQGVRFGPGATGGVVNIITKRGAAERQTQVGIRYGSFNTRAGEVRTSGLLGAFDYSFGASGLKSDGFSNASEAEGATEKDGTEISALSSRLGFKNETGFDLDATVRVTNNKADLDRGGGVANDDPNYTSEFQQISAGLTARMPVAGGVSRFGYYFTKLDRSGENLADAGSVDTSVDQFNGTIHKVDLSYDRKLTTYSSLLVSLQNKHENADSTANYSGFDVTFPEKSQSLNTVGATYAYDDKKFFGDLGLRFDDNSRLDSKVNYRVALGTRLFDGNTTFQAAVGSALKTPSLYQLYSAYGDATLQAEDVTTYSISLLQKITNQISLDVTAFQNDYTSLIDFDSTTSLYRNYGDVQSKGVEAELNYDVGAGVVLSSSYRYLDARNRETDLRLVRRSRNAWTTSAEYTLQSWKIRGDYRFRDSFVDSDPVTFGRIDKPSFSVVDLHTSYQVATWLEAFVRVENVFDKIYQEVAGYGTPRRSAYLGLTGTF